MQLIILSLFVITFLTGFFCQTIVLQNLSITSPCISKARAEFDYFSLTGTIGNSISQLLAEQWERIVNIFMKSPTTVHSTIVCTFQVDGGICATFGPSHCDCVYAEYEIQFAINQTLQLESSKADVFGLWKHLNGVSVYSENRFTLPEIYEIHSARLTLTIADVTTLPTTSGSCAFNLKLNRSNVMKLCCSDMALPCYAQIAFRGIVVVNNESPCVYYVPTFDEADGRMVLSYSVCTQTSYLFGESCTVLKGVVPISPTGVMSMSTTVSTPAVIPVTTDLSNEPPNAWDFNLVITNVGVVMLILVALIIIACVIGMKRAHRAASDERRNSKEQEIEEPDNKQGGVVGGTLLEQANKDEDKESQV